MTVDVFRLFAEDIPDLVEVENSAFTHPWTEQMFCDEMENEAAVYFGLKKDGELLGYVGYWHILDEAHIMNVAIKKEYQGQGLGTRLLKEVLTFCMTCGIVWATLEVRVSNASARHVYEKIGFQNKGIRPNYYDDNREDAVIYWLNLEELL